MPLRPAFDAYLAPARRHPQLWRLLVGLVLAAAVYLAGLGALSVLLASVSQAGWPRLADVAVGATPTAALLLLVSFGAMGLGTVISARLLQRRSLRSLIGPPGRALRHFGAAVLTVVVVYSIVLAPWPAIFDGQANLPLTTWLMLLPLSLAGVALQTFAEEVTFRGYIMQQLAVRFRSPLIWMGVPTLLFGALHWDPGTHGPNTWPVLATITVFALAAADLTRRTGCLGAAWGMHFANNCIALLVLATGTPLSGLALYRTPYSGADPSLLWSLAGDLAAIALTWGILARRLGRAGAA